MDSQGAESVAWSLILPAAAECTASVWYPDVSINGVDLQLLSLNLLGALLEGFFHSTGVVNRAAMAESGPVGTVLVRISVPMQNYFLSTFTSWAGMVGKAAYFAGEARSGAIGLLYIVISVLLGIAAHSVGAAASTGYARYARPHSSSTSPAIVTAMRLSVLAGALAYVIATYVSVRNRFAHFEDSDSFHDQEQPSLFSLLDAEHRRLLVAIVFSVAGARCGNLSGDYVDTVASRGSATITIARGTLVCNAMFALLGLSLNVATLHRAPLARSVLLQSFAGSFCGAASAFNGHASDASALLAQHTGGRSDALRNMLANLVLALLVFAIAYELESLIARAVTIDLDGDGAVTLSELRHHYRL